MKALTRLDVKPEMHVQVTLDMTIAEMDALLELTRENTRWPMFTLRECLRQSLEVARQAYTSEVVTGA